MSKSIKSRDYLFDNYKALLIILVIIGHFIQPCYENNTLLYTTKYFIYTFHMPAFIFISGYFSRGTITLRKAFQKVLMPYISFQMIYYIYYNYFIGLDADLALTVPKFSLWYLLALFVWKVATPYVKKIPHYFLLSVVLGLAVGLVPEAGAFLSIARIFVFYPYFLAGTLLDRELLMEARKKPYRIISISGILAFIVFLVTAADSVGFRLSYFYGKTSYSQMGQAPMEGILIRLLCYVIGFFFTYAFAILMTEKKTVFSMLGSATMSIYLFHGLTYKFFEHCTSMLEQVNTIPESVLLIVFCVLLAFVLTWRPFATFTNAYSNISLTKFGEYAEKASYYHSNALARLQTYQTRHFRRVSPLLDA